MEQLTPGSFGDLIGTVTTHLVHADSMAKDATLDRTLKAFDSGNFDLTTEVGLIGLDQPLKLSMNLPKAILTPLNPIEIQEAKMNLSMDISSHEESASALDSETEVSGSATVGAGLFKASMSVKANVGVHKSQKRSTDKRSSCEVDVTMGQGEQPEGVGRILDAMLTVVDKGTDMNLMLIEVQADKMRAAASDMDDSDETDTDDGFGDDANIASEDAGNGTDGNNDSDSGN